MNGKRSLAFQLVLYVFLMMLAAMLVAGAVMLLLNHLGFPVLGQVAGPDFRPLGAFVALTILSVVIGVALASFFSRRALKPIRRLAKAMRAVARGDFSVQAEGRDAIRELDDLYTGFNRMTRELAGTQALRNDFINNFSHEFKTPIVSIRGFAKLLKDDRLTPDERREYLEIIITESERLSTLATHVLNLSKYEAMEIVAEKETFRVDEQLRRVIAAAEPLWAARGITPEVTLEEASFEGNADLIAQAWLNLLDNAIKFSPDAGKIMVTMHTQATATGHTLVVAFADEGIGMDENTRARVFDKFYQGDASRITAGNGLGLAIVKRIIEMHGGRVAADSTPGRGSVFRVAFPVG